MCGTFFLNCGRLERYLYSANDWSIIVSMRYFPFLLVCPRIFIFLGAAFLNDFILFTQYFFKGATLFQSDMMEMEKILRIPSRKMYCFLVSAGLVGENVSHSNNAVK